MSSIKLFFVHSMIFLLFISKLCFAKEAKLTLDFQNMPLKDAITFFAKSCHMNVILSSSIKGNISLYLKEAAVLKALDLLLLANGLEKWPLGDILFIGLRKEMMNNQESSIKWKQMQSSSKNLLTEFWQIQYAKAKNIAKLINGEKHSLLSSEGSIRVDPRTNIICMQDHQKQIETVRKLIKKLDVPLKQILIQAKLVSIDSDFEQELGLRFSFFPFDKQTGDDAVMQSKEKNNNGLALLKLADHTLIDVKLSALERAGHAKLISSPSLFASNQQPASIEAGEEVPYQEVSESGGTALTFKKAVLGLKVIPHLMPGHKVLIQLKINQDRPSHRMVLGVPTISTRQITTEVLLKNGQTVVLGGIYETNEEQGDQGVPFFNKLPVVGFLFTQKRHSFNKRELLIFVTPKIMTNTNE